MRDVAPGHRSSNQTPELHARGHIGGGQRATSESRELESHASDGCVQVQLVYDRLGDRQGA